MGEGKSISLRIDQEEIGTTKRLGVGLISNKPRHDRNASRRTLVLPGVEIRLFLGMKSACLHGSKRQTAALAAMAKRIAPPPRQWFASPGCIRPQPAIDPATGLDCVATAKHFLFPKNAHHQLCADFDRR